MSDHLPECYLSGHPGLCPMCEALRACEQRVLDAALDAVSASSDHDDLCICDECCGTEAALAAIDGLKTTNH